MEMTKSDTRSVETDAVVGKSDFRKVLKEIDDDLTRRDLNCLKFLCYDIIPVAKLEQISRALNLFDHLEMINKIGDGNIWLLAELLLIIGRIDLVKKLGLAAGPTRAFIDAVTSQVSPYRKLLYEICEDLTNRDLETAKFMASKSDISRRKMESVKTWQDLLQCLEQAELLTPSKLVFLKEILDALDRSDLIQKVERLESGILLPGDMRLLSAGQDPLSEKTASSYTSYPDKLSYSSDSISNRTTSSDHINYSPGYYVQNPVVTGPEASGCKPNSSVHGGAPQSAEMLTQNYNYPRDVQILQRTVGATQHRYPSRKERQVTFSPTTMYTQPQPPFYLPPQRDLNPEYFQRVVRIHSQYGATGHHMCGPRVQKVPPMAPELDDEMPCYSMNHRPRGICLIISNEKFTQVKNDPESVRMPNREGTNIDCAQMETIFKKLHFVVHTYEDLTDTQISKTLANCAVNVDHSKFDCFVCCILTHGAEGKLYGTNGRLVAIKDLLNFFKGVSSPTLRGKPKLFFIQACQGKDKQPAVPLEQDGPNDGTVDMETIPNEADFLLGYASLPGFVSYRSKSTGSWYISTLYHMLSRYAQRYDLLSILVKVNEEVGRATAHSKHKQSPAPLVTLRKKIYFS